MRVLTTMPLLLRYGMYRYSFLSEERVVEWFEQGAFISAIRRPEVATYLAARFGRPIPLKTARIQNTIEVGDESLVAMVTSEEPLTLRYGSLTRLTSSNLSKAEALAEAALATARATHVPRRTIIGESVLHAYGYYLYRCATAHDASQWLGNAYVSGLPYREAVDGLSRLTNRAVNAFRPFDTERLQEIEQQALQDPGDQVLLYRLRLPPPARPTVYPEARSSPPTLSLSLDDTYIHTNSQIGILTRLNEHTLPTSFL